MGFFNLMSAAAASFTVAGNTGISPFLALFLVGLIEKAYPDALNMGETTEMLLSSWPALCVLGIMTILELVGKCIPVVDEVIDSVMTFVIPIMASLGSLSTFGLYSQVETSGENAGNRELSVSSNALLAFQLFVLVIGVGLAFAMHALKMLVRVLGVGCLTNCIAILEVICVVTTVSMSIFVKEIAILIAFLMSSAAIYGGHRIYKSRQEKKQLEQLELQQQTSEEHRVENELDRAENGLEEHAEAQVIAIEGGESNDSRNTEFNDIELTAAQKY